MSRHFSTTRPRRPPTVDEHANLQEIVLKGAAATHLAEFAEQVILNEEEDSIRRNIFAMIGSGEPLNPQKAVEAWLQLHAAYRLVERLNRIKRAGETANLRLTEQPPKEA